MEQLNSLHPPESQQTVGWMLAAWDADSGLDELVALPTGAGNAAIHFRELEKYYFSEKKLLEDDGTATRGVGALLAAADMAECRLSPDYYPVYDAIDAQQPELVVLQSYLRGLLRRGEKAGQRGDYQEAERCFRAALICGRHLTRDKSSSLVYAAGLTYSIRGAQAYAKYLTLTGDTQKAEAVKRYLDRQSAIMRAYIWKSNTALSEFDGFACLFAAIRIATTDKEAFWRKQAVGNLATLRYGVPDSTYSFITRNPAFEKLADDALISVAARDPDAAVRRLARWAALQVRPSNYDAMEHRFLP